MVVGLGAQNDLSVIESHTTWIPFNVLSRTLYSNSVIKVIFVSNYSSKLYLSKIFLLTQKLILVLYSTLKLKTLKYFIFHIKAEVSN